MNRYRGNKISRVLRKTHFASLDGNTKVYLNLQSGKVGVVRKVGNTTLHVGGNPKSGGFARVQHDSSTDSRAYACVKAHQTDVGVVKKFGKHVEVKLAANIIDGPIVEARYRGLKFRRRAFR